MSDLSKAKSVAIVGSGLSGLAAAGILHKLGFQVTIFESGDRIGGRVFSVWEGPTQLAIGAMWLHGGIKNPIYPLVKRLGLLEPTPGEDNLPDLCYQKDTYQYDWAQAASVTASGRMVANKLLISANSTVRRLMDEAYELPEDRIASLYSDRLGAYVESQFPMAVRRAPKFDPETYEAALRMFALFYAACDGVHSLNDLSVLGGADYSNPAGQILVRGGFCRLAEKMAETLPQGCVRLRSRVERVSVADDGSATLLVGSELLKFDHALVTVSLGVLQTGNLIDSSLVSSDWLSAVNQMRMGTVDKIFLRFALPLRLPNDCNHLWILAEKFNGNWLDGIFSISTVNEARDIFLLWVGGNYAKEMESLPTEQVEADLIQYIETALRRKLPRVTKMWRSSFASDPNFLGSYSSYKPGCIVKSALKLSQPIQTTLTNGGKKPVICFAGEHTMERQYATVQGAVLSGVREARRLATHYQLEEAKGKDLTAMLAA